MRLFSPERVSLCLCFDWRVLHLSYDGGIIGLGRLLFREQTTWFTHVTLYVVLVVLISHGIQKQQL